MLIFNHSVTTYSALAGTHVNPYLGQELISGPRSYFWAKGSFQGPEFVLGPRAYFGDDYPIGDPKGLVSELIGPF